MTIKTTHAELAALKARYLEVASALFSARSISKDDLQSASWCLQTLQTALDENFMYSFGWESTRKAMQAHRGNLPGMKNKRIAKLIGDLMDDVTEWTDAREAAVK